MIKKHYSSNSRKALNVIWNAAGDYDFDPPFLAFYSNGRPDFYFNVIIGLTKKWLDIDKITAFIDSYSYASTSDEYDEYVWLALESCLYGKEIDSRPALSDLRKAHAEEFFRIQQTLSKQQMELMSMPVYTQQQARWSAVTGRKMPIMSPKEHKIYEALMFPSELDTDALIKRLSEFLKEYFRFDPHASDKEAGRHKTGLFKKLWGRHKYAQIKNTGHLIVRTGTGDGDPANAVLLKQENGFKKTVGDDAETRAYIEACFGKSLYPETELSNIESVLCSGDDIDCKLWFAEDKSSHKHTPTSPDVSAQNENRTESAKSGDNKRPDKTDPYDYSSLQLSKQALREISNAKSSVNEQRSKNIDYFRKHSMQINESIRKLSSELETVISSYLKHLPEPSERGILDTRKIYRLAVLDDQKVFLREGDEAENNLSLTILLDASQSRMNSQELIASEAYTLSESFVKAGISVQILSFRSIKGYTVLSRLKSFEDKRSDGVFGYFAAGWNRDALALKACGHMISDIQKKDHDRQHILLVLTDASPNDSVPLALKPGEKRPGNYEGLIPVENAREAVNELRKSGIKTAAVFHGSTAHLENAYRIYGKEYIRIRSLAQLAGGIIDLMQSVLRENVPE